MDLSKAVKFTGKYLADHAPQILTGFAVAGVVTTTVLAAQGGAQAKELLDNERLFRLKAEDVDTIEDFTLKEKFFITWRAYVPAGIAAATTLTCVIGAQGINQNRQAALIGAYTLLEKGSAQYQEKVLEAVGEKKDTQIRDSVAKQQLEEAPSGKNMVYMGTGEHLFYDPYGNNYFKSSMETIRQIVNNVNELLLSGDTVSLNEFYGMLGINPCNFGNEVGWRADHLMECHYSSHLNDDGTPVGVVNFRREPTPNFYKLR